MTRLVAAVLVLAAATGMAGPAAAASFEDIPCPVEVRAEPRISAFNSADPMPSMWTVTSQSSGVVTSAIEDIGGQRALVCKYRLFGSLYWVHRAPPNEFPYCRATEGGFRCERVRR